MAIRAFLAFQTKLHLLVRVRFSFNRNFKTEGVDFVFLQTQGRIVEFSQNSWEYVVFALVKSIYLFFYKYNNLPLNKYSIFQNL